jgi:hypothetical protein
MLTFSQISGNAKHLHTLLHQAQAHPSISWTCSRPRPAPARNDSACSMTVHVVGSDRSYTHRTWAVAEPLQPVERVVRYHKGPGTCHCDRYGPTENRCNCNPSHDGTSRPRSNPRSNDTTDRRGKNHTAQENVTAKRAGRRVALAITTAARGQPAPTPPGSAPAALIAIVAQ